jgi:hypothetical protein
MIPKKVHLSWKTKELLDSESPLITEGVKKLIELNPNWEVTIYDDAEGLLILGVACYALAACTQLNSLEITPEDNAMACLRGNTNAAGAVLGANVSGITVELPASVDTSNWTADDWKTLAELCD